MREVVEPRYSAHPEWRRRAVHVGSLPAVTGLIAMAQENPAIEGLSIDLHVETEAQIVAAFESVRGLMPEKPIIVPEYSAHRLYLKNVTETLGYNEEGRDFAACFHRSPALKLHEWYRLANQHKVSAEEWAALFATREWFTTRFLMTCYDYFQRYHVRLATCGFVSQYAPAAVPAKGMAWFINPIFPQKRLPLAEGGSYPPNPLWFDDFVTIVKQGTPKPE